MLHIDFNVDFKIIDVGELKESKIDYAAIHGD